MTPPGRARAGAPMQIVAALRSTAPAKSGVIAAARDHLDIDVPVPVG